MISLLIPIRGEPAIAACAFSRLGPEIEILVADGDRAGAAAAAFEKIGARVLSFPGSNRGERLASAARESRGDILAFLHSDSRLPAGARETIEDAVRSGAAWGAFRLAYDDDSPSLRWIAWWANLRSRVFQLPFGDQGVFCTRAAYERTGGYPELPICDDLAFALRLRRVGGFRLLPGACVTSARAYRGRSLRQVLTNWKVMTGYFLGARPETLERWYRAAGRLSSRETRP